MAWLTDVSRRWDKADARLSSVEASLARIHASRGVIASLRRFAAARSETSRRADLVRLKGEIERASDRRFEQRGIHTGVLPILTHSAHRLSDFANRFHAAGERYRMDGRIEGIESLLDDMDCLDPSTRRSIVAILRELSGTSGLPSTIFVARAFRECVEREGESLADPFIALFAAAMRRRAADMASLAWRMREDLTANMEPAVSAAMRRVRERLIPAETL